MELTFLSFKEISKFFANTNMGMDGYSTDFAICCGADVNFKSKIGYYFTSDIHREYAFSQPAIEVKVVDSCEDYLYMFIRNKDICIRPVIKNVSTIDELYKLITIQKGTEIAYRKEFYYGEYPNEIVNPIQSKFLEHFFQKNKLSKTNKTYTIKFGTKKKDLLLEEYIIENKKYVRMPILNDNFDNIYDNIEKIEDNKDSFYNYTWVEVKPVKWIYDEISDTAMTDKLILSGIIFSSTDTMDLKKTSIYKYMNEYLVKDIMPSNIKRKENISNNPYNFDFSEVSEEDILRGCIESNTAVMLHGESGDGKSARVKELDKDAVVVYMLTQGLDSFAGKSVLINNELVDIPPTWYTKLKSICDEEPDKLHIVFFDEIANAPPSVQAMAFNVVLEHEINGKWKLPKNARVVAAMNEMTESRSSYGLSEPLYNRFAHVYIKTNPNDWLKWAISEESDYEKLEYKEEIKRKIHPSIYAYISYKSDALRTKYTGVSPNADPRKWEMASKVLYTTNNPNMIRSLVGEEITYDFINFCTSKVITIEDVLTGNYTEYDLDLNTSSKYNTVVALSKVDIEHFEIIREFTKKLGSEMVSLLDTLWATSIEKLEILQEITLSEKIKA